MTKQDLQLVLSSTCKKTSRQTLENIQSNLFWYSSSMGVSDIIVKMKFHLYFARKKKSM